MSNIHKEILLNGNKAIANGNYKAFLDLCTDDTVWEFVGDQTLTGKEAVRAYMQATYLEPPVVTVNNLIAEGDMLTAVGEISLKEKKGSVVNYDYCDVWQFRGNKLAKLRAFVVAKEV